MKMKNRNKIIAFFFLIIFFTQAAGFVLAAEEIKEKEYWDNYTSVVDQVDVKLKTNLPSHIKHEMGNAQLVEFKARSSQKINDSLMLYTADLIIDVQFNLGTDLSIDKLSIQSSEVTERWGVFHTCTDFGRSKTFTFEGQNYDLNKNLGFSGTFRERDVKTTVFDLKLQTRSITIDPQQIGVRQPLEFEIKMNEPRQNFDFGNDNITIKNKAFLYDIYNVQIVESSTNTLPEYNNIWQSEIKTELNVQAPNIGGAAQSDLNTAISSYGPGVWFTKYEDKTIVQGQKAPVSVGNKLTKLDNNTFQMRAPDLIPNLVEYRQFYKTKSIEAAIDTETDSLRISPAKVTVLSTATAVTEKSRVIGYKLQNYASQYKLRIKIELNSLCEVTIKQTAPNVPLNNMTIERPDYYWDNFATGATEAQIFAQRSQNLANWELLGADIALWAKQNWWIIALVAILAIGGVALYLHGFVPAQPPAAPTRADSSRPQTRKIEFFTFKQYGARSTRRRKRQKR